MGPSFKRNLCKKSFLARTMRLSAENLYNRGAKRTDSEGQNGSFSKACRYRWCPKIPPRIVSTTIFIYISKTNFLQENKEARDGSRFRVQRFWVMKFRVSRLGIWDLGFWIEKVVSVNFVLRVAGYELRVWRFRISD